MEVCDEVSDCDGVCDSVAVSVWLDVCDIDGETEVDWEGVPVWVAVPVAEGLRLPV